MTCDENTKPTKIPTTTTAPGQSVHAIASRNAMSARADASVQRAGKRHVSEKTTHELDAPFARRCVEKAGEPSQRRGRGGETGGLRT